MHAGLRFKEWSVLDHPRAHLALAAWLQARTKAQCPTRFLGVSKATCNMPYGQFKYGAASLFVKTSPGARTVWRLERA